MACDCCNTDECKPDEKKQFGIELNDKQNIVRLIAGAVILITGIILDKVLRDSYISFILITAAYLLL